VPCRQIPFRRPGYQGEKKPTQQIRGDLRKNGSGERKWKGEKKKNRHTQRRRGKYWELDLKELYDTAGGG